MFKRTFSILCCISLFTSATMLTSCKTEVMEPKKVTISYNTGLDNYKMEPKIVNIGYKLTEKDIPNLQSENKNFDGWFINDKKAEVNLTINKNTVLIAKWNTKSINNEIKQNKQQDVSAQNTEPSKESPSKTDNNPPKEAIIKINIKNKSKIILNIDSPTNQDEDFANYELSISPVIDDYQTPKKFDKSTKEIVFESLDNTKDYTFTLKSVDKLENKSNGVSVTSKYNIGDILYDDGSKADYTSFTEVKGTKPVAIVCGIKDNQLYGLGLKQKTSSWANRWGGTFNVSTKIESNVPEQVIRSNNINDFKGEKDGEIIQKKVLANHNNVSSSVFDFAKKYGSTNSLNNCKDGWYIPSVYELYTYLYKNHEEIEKAIKKLGSNNATPILYSNNFWSSSESKLEKEAYAFHLTKGSFYSTPKISFLGVCCFRKFPIQQ